MKRPAFQFYPSDWRKDTALQACSLEARGLWIEMMCLAHECEPYGHLVVNGGAIKTPQISRLVGIHPRRCAALMAELTAAKVLSIAESGAIYSRRMVRDEQVRCARAEGGKSGANHGIKGGEHGSKGGRPRLATGDKEPPLYPPPSSSSSSSSSSKKKVTRKPDGLLDGDFEMFWNAYPRRDGKKRASESFHSALKRASLAKIMSGAMRYADQRRGEPERFTKLASTWLNGDHWHDGAPATAPKPNGNGEWNIELDENSPLSEADELLCKVFGGMALDVGIFRKRATGFWPSIHGTAPPDDPANKIDPVVLSRWGYAPADIFEQWRAKHVR